jgi:uncharacterized membrane protein
MNIPRLLGLLKPALRWLALVFVVLVFWQAVPMDMLAMFVAGDMATYFEIAIAVWLVSQVTRVRWAAAYASLAVRRTLRRARARARRAVRRRARLRPPPGDDGRPAGAFAFA